MKNLNHSIVKLMFLCIFLISNAVSAQIIIDVEKLGTHLNKGPVGLCLSFVTDEDSRYPERVQTHAEAFSEMKVGTLRWPMGTLADNYLWHTPGEYESVDNGLKPCVASGRTPADWTFCTNPDGTFNSSTMNFDEFVALCTKMNVEPVVMVNALGHTHKGAKYNLEQLKTSAVEMVKYAKRKGYRIKYWEIGNETSLAIRDKHMTVVEYTDLFNDFSRSMKEVDPSIKTGLGLGFGYFKEVLKGTYKNADFIVPHIYVSRYKSYAAYENDAPRIKLNSVEATQKALDELPEPYKSNIKMLVTEFSSFSPQRVWDNFDNDIGKSLVTFDLAATMLSQYANMEYLHFWVTHSPWGDISGMHNDYANSLDKYLNVLPQGKALQMFNQFAQERMLNLDPVSGKVRVFASYSPSSNSLSVYLLNKGTNAVTQKVQLKNFKGTSENQVWVYQGEGSPNSTETSIAEQVPVSIDDNTFGITLPPVSISVVVLGANNKKLLQSYEQRLIQLNKKIELVETALKEAEGFQKKSGHIDLQVAKFFSEYITWELEHPEIMKDALMGKERIKVGSFSRAINSGADIDLQERERRYHFHIDYELKGSMEILNQALERLEINAEWPEVVDIQWNEMKFANGYFRIDKHPVFTGGFNVLDFLLVDEKKYPEWAEKEKEEILPEFLKEMQKIGVGIIDVAIRVPDLILKDGTIDKLRINQIAAKIRRYDKLGFRVNIRFQWNGKNQVGIEQLWPDITKYYGHFVHFDIDHPGAREMVSTVMAELMPELQKLTSIVSWDLANEPDFRPKMWGPYTLKKYHKWLSGNYKNIGQLNKVWKTEYSSIESIPLPKDKTQEECSPGEWYDMITFHHYRVMSFFKLVQTKIRHYMPEIPIHMKAQDNSSLGPMRSAVTDGIDREILTPLLNIQGVDTRPLPITEPRMAAEGYDASIYGFHWLGQSFLYDYLTSLEPQHSIVDFEYHAFSINNIRVPDMNQSHPRAALWLAHLHGQISNMTWYWHRRHGPNPFPTNNYLLWFYGSLSGQPLVAAEYFQTMLRLNAFSEEVEALATAPTGPVRILVSKPSYIQNQAHINALHRVYEATCFYGQRIGFVTEQMLESGGVPEGCKTIIIPDVEYVSASALKVLEKAVRQSVQLVRYGDKSIAFDPHGFPHNPDKLEFLKKVPVYNYAEAPKLSMVFESILAPYKNELPVKVSVVNGNAAFGVMHRFAEVNGETVLLLVNVSDKAVQVQLQSKNGQAVEGYDMLNGEVVKGDGVNLSFEGVRLIKITL